MYISLGGTWLTNPNDGTSERLVTSSRNLKVNGKIIVQSTKNIRAISMAFRARGNLETTINFKVTRRFTTIAAAFSFAATHRSLLPTSGGLVMVCGWPSEGQIICSADNAMLEECDYDSDDTPGVSITHSYFIRCGAININDALLNKNGSNLLNKQGTPLINK